MIMIRPKRSWEGVVVLGLSIYAIKKLLSGNPNGPLEQPQSLNSCTKRIARAHQVPRDESVRRFTPQRQYHRYWTEAPKPHHLETDAFKDLSFRRIFSW